MEGGTRGSGRCFCITGVSGVCIWVIGVFEEWDRTGLDKIGLDSVTGCVECHCIVCDLGIDLGNRCLTNTTVSRDIASMF